MQTCEFSVNQTGYLAFNGLELFFELERDSKSRTDHASAKVEICSAVESDSDVDLKINVDELLAEEKTVRWTSGHHLRFLLKVRERASLLQILRLESNHH
jgi:hypothetical protein